jgi:exportin-2 (importin alpha re-exporter)
VTRVNSMLNVHDFFQQTIKPDLVDGSEQLAPLLKLEIMKFTLNYRSQLSKEELTVTLPRLMVHLQSKSYILHTFAALTIEKLLSLKRSGEPLFSSTDIRAMIDNLSFSIIALIFGHKTVDKMCENHFLTRTLMHVLDVAQPADIDRILSKFSDRLVWLFQEIGRNPVNPQFNHYYYECIVLCVSTASEQHRAQLELKLVPIIFGLLQADQTDFFPYAFQILTALVECHEALPEYAKSVLPLMGQPVLWSPASGSIPALVRFIQACANRDQDVIAAQTNGLMAIVRSLIFSRVNDSHGFALMNVFFRVLSEAELCKVARPLLLMVLNRVQVHKSPRFNLNFLVSLSYFVVESNLTPSTAANLLIEVLNQIQPR